MKKDRTKEKASNQRMNNGVTIACQKFIKNLTGASTEEIQSYSAEISADREFYNRLEGNQMSVGRRRFSSWGIGPTLGVVLYVICRKLRPEAVVETGVSSGVSSSYILHSLEDNKSGALYSIDLPGQGQSGWLIPDYLRHRWQLIPGMSVEELPPLLEKLRTIDIFLHDSEHSYENMLWEYQTAWVHLKAGGILLSHNIDSNYAFDDFCQSVGVEGYALSNLGGIVKA